jgi:hypothetical protein
MEHLIKLISESTEREAKKLEIIKDESKRPFHVLSFIGINEILFIDKAFVQKDFFASKNHLYKIGMTYAYNHEKFGGEVFEALKTFTYPVLSDSTSLIHRFTHYEKTQYSDAFSAHYARGIQAVLKNDNKFLQEAINGLTKQSKSGWPKEYAGVVTAFEGFLKSDEVMIKRGIEQIVARHGKQNQPLVVKEFINFEATALAKLAWRRGIQVEVESPLVPKELLPVNELSQYEGYPFFSEINEA